jgi:membrane protein YqaA with SNARE-associated domain
MTLLYMIETEKMEKRKKVARSQQSARYVMFILLFSEAAHFPDIFDCSSS